MALPFSRRIFFGVLVAWASASQATLSLAERDALLAFLRQLDGSNTPGGSDVLFVNGFED